MSDIKFPEWQREEVPQELEGDLMAVLYQGDAEFGIYNGPQDGWALFINFKMIKNIEDSEIEGWHLLPRL